MKKITKFNELMVKLRLLKYRIRISLRDTPNIEPGIYGGYRVFYTTTDHHAIYLLKDWFKTYKEAIEAEESMQRQPNVKRTWIEYRRAHYDEFRATLAINGDGINSRFHKILFDIVDSGFAVRKQIDEMESLGLPIIRALDVFYGRFDPRSRLHRSMLNNGRVTSEIVMFALGTLVKKEEK